MAKDKDDPKKGTKVKPIPKDVKRGGRLKPKEYFD